MFVRNLPSDMLNKELEELCSKYGKIEVSTIRTDEQGKSRGYG